MKVSNKISNILKVIKILIISCINALFKETVKSMQLQDYTNNEHG